MCIIIDACCAVSLAQGNLPQASLIRKWVKEGGRIVSGGQLARELARTPMKPLLAEWRASGRLLLKADDEVRQAEASIQAIGIKSDDPHVLALQKLSGSKLIVTSDKKLMSDLKNPLVTATGTKIYTLGDQPVAKLKRHRRLLKEAHCD